MRELFGTDGIRGKANTYPMDAETVLRLGQALGFFLAERESHHARVLIGKDTRLSGYMIESALCAGLTSMGVEVYLVGPMPTPAVAHLTNSMLADAGIMITASHNPPEDNGIKIFDSVGIKLNTEDELFLERMVLSKENICNNTSEVGKAFRIDDAAGRFIELNKAAIGNMPLRGLKVVVDCANGAAYRLAPLILEELGVETIVINNEPDGHNINEASGALYPDKMAEHVLRTQADCGVAFDGDADRAVFSDGEGQIINGDTLITLLSLSLKAKGELDGRGIAVTKMSNLGLYEALGEADIPVTTTDIGDKNVLEAMISEDLAFGGEESGHLIFRKTSNVGDGILTALKVFEEMKRTGKSLHELSKCMTVYPSRLINLRVETKKELSSLESFQKEISECEATLGTHGRLLIRYSGTENLLRILIEAKEQEMIDLWSARLEFAADKELN